jgi:hypothetical protein
LSGKWKKGDKREIEAHSLIINDHFIKIDLEISRIFLALGLKTLEQIGFGGETNPPYLVS